MTSKTPISVLQEYLVSNGEAPRYELIHNGTGTHNPLFVFRVRVGMFWEDGEGRSKQEAKHRAAEKMLKTLNIENNDSTCDLNFPQSDSIENYVGKLKEYCIIQNYPDPKYEVEEEAGPSHSKIFKIVCIVSQLREYGVSKTKKNAKQIAASRMMELLSNCTTSKNVGNKNNENDQTTDFVECILPKKIKYLPPETITNEQVLEKYNNLRNNSNSVAISKVNACYYKDHHKAYLHLPELSQTMLKILNKEEIVTSDNAEDLLREIAVELNAKLTRNIAPKDEKDDSVNWVFLGMSGEFINPPLAGVGLNDQFASINLINSLQVLCSSQRYTLP